MSLLSLFYTSRLWLVTGSVGSVDLVFDIAYRMCQLTLLATDKTGTLTRNQMTVRTENKLYVNQSLNADHPGNESMELRQNVLSLPVKQ